jgi:hypothetical protein
MFNLKKLRIMKTLETDPFNKPKRTTRSGKTSSGRKVTTGKLLPSEEDIRKKAMEIYHERIASGEHGTAVDDWLKAERLLMSSKK